MRIAVVVVIGVLLGCSGVGGLASRDATPSLDIARGAVGTNPAHGAAEPVWAELEAELGPRAVAGVQALMERESLQDTLEPVMAGEWSTEIQDEVPTASTDVRRHLGGGIYLTDFVLLVDMQELAGSIRVTGRSVDVFTDDQLCSWFADDPVVQMPPADGEARFATALIGRMVETALAAEAMNADPCDEISERTATRFVTDDDGLVIEAVRLP